MNLGQEDRGTLPTEPALPERGGALTADHWRALKSQPSRPRCFATCLPRPLLLPQPLSLSR